MSAAVTQEIKIFKINDYEWWAGADLESIKSAYKEQTGIEPDSDEGFDSPRQLGDEEMQRKTIWFEEGEEPDSATFREHLDHLIALGHAFPCHFAGTEY